MSHHDKNWPTTVEAAALKIIAVFPEEEMQLIRETPFGKLGGFHFGLGLYIRNFFGLLRGNDALIAAACGGLGDADDASAIIIEEVWRILQEPQQTTSE